MPGTTPIPNTTFQSRNAAPSYYQKTNTNYAGSSKTDYNYPKFPAYGDGIYISDLNPYHAPMGVPLMPLYGYDNCEDSDKDWDYMKQMYPINAKKLLGEIEDECDKLEYDGSCMFDEYPDKVYLGRIVDRIYSKYGYMEEDAVNCESIPASKQSGNNIQKPLQSNQYDIDWDYRRDRRGRRPRWLRDLIEVLLYNEILNRRRRYRGRRRWF